jgi:hypothetical protein
MRRRLVRLILMAAVGYGLAQARNRKIEANARRFGLPS